MSKKKRKKGKKRADNQSTQKVRPQKNLRGYRGTYVILGIMVIVAIAAVIFLSNGFGDLTGKSASAAGDRSSEQKNHTDQSASGNPEGPSIYFPEESYDFGTISQGTKASHTFVVKNTGSEPLRLISAKGS